MPPNFWFNTHLSISIIQRHVPQKKGQMLGGWGWVKVCWGWLFVTGHPIASKTVDTKSHAWMSREVRING